MLRSVGADLLIMGTGGVTETGLSNSNPLVVGSERAMIDVSRRVVVVTDPSKFGRQAMVPVASLDERGRGRLDRGPRTPSTARFSKEPASS